MIGRSLVVAVLVLSACASVAGASDVVGQPLDLDPGRVGWRSLEFEASKLFVTARASAELTHSDDTSRLVLDSAVLGRRSETRLDFDSRTAVPRVEERLKVSGDAELRSFHYGESSALRVRYHAESKDHADRPRAAWREKSREDQPYGVEAGPRRPTSPSSLLYVLSASDLDQVGDRLVLPVFTKGRTVQAVAEVVEATTADAVPLDGADAAAGEWPALKIRVGGRSADGGPIDLELFGLDGDLEIVLDRRHRLPLSIRGAMSVVGTVDVELCGATLAR